MLPGESVFPFKRYPFLRDHGTHGQTRQGKVDQINGGFRYAKKGCQAPAQGFCQAQPFERENSLLPLDGDVPVAIRAGSARRQAPYQDSQFQQRFTRERRLQYVDRVSSQLLAFPSEVICTLVPSVSDN